MSTYYKSGSEKDEHCSHSPMTERLKKNPFLQVQHLLGRDTDIEWKGTIWVRALRL